MKTIGTKILILIIGLLLGFIGGGGLAWYSLGNKSSEKNIFIFNNNPNENADKSKNNLAKKNEQQKTIGKKKTSETIVNKDHENKIDFDTTNVKNTNIDNSELGNKKIISASPNDSAMLDSMQIVDYTSSEENIIVKKDELIFLKNIVLIDLNVKKESTISVTKDSLMQTDSGIKETTNSLFTIEYWQSPINYKGYKMEKNKLLLFGLKTDEDSKIYKLNGVHYLKSGTKFYKVENSTEYKPFETIGEQNILSLINK